MKPIFLDTWYWVTLLTPRNGDFLRADSALRQEGSYRFVTTEEVLVEFLNFVSVRFKGLRGAAAALIQKARQERDLTVIPQSRGSFLRGLELFMERSDKNYSMTDCISMTTMRALGIRAVLTQDHHFGQEGFRVLIQKS